MKSPPNKLSIANCVEAAKIHGGWCLSETYQDIFKKLKWKCKNGHVWETSLNDVRNKKHWCVICAGHDIITLDVCRAAAKVRGGRCLSKAYKNARLGLKWRCENGFVLAG